MVLNFIKDTARLIIEKCFSNSAPVVNIAELSKVSNLTPGSCSEISAKNWLLKNRWTIEAHRKKVARVEVDFLARDPTGLLHIIEVKSAGALNRNIVSYKQQRRL